VSIASEVVAAAVREIIADLPFGAAIEDQDASVHRISAEIGRYFESGGTAARPNRSIDRPVFYRGRHALAVAVSSATAP